MTYTLNDSLPPGDVSDVDHRKMEKALWFACSLSTYRCMRSFPKHRHSESLLQCITQFRPAFSCTYSNSHTPTIRLRSFLPTFNLHLIAPLVAAFTAAPCLHPFSGIKAKLKNKKATEQIEQKGGRRRRHSLPDITMGRSIGTFAFEKREHLVRTPESASRRLDGEQAHTCEQRDRLDLTE